MVILAAVSQCGLALEYVPPQYKSNKILILAAAKGTSGEFALLYADESLKADREFVL